MDCIVPTHYRPERLACTLATLLPQSFDGPRRLFLVDNSRPSVCDHPQVRKTLRALTLAGWDIFHQPSQARTITEIKLEALRCGNAAHLALFDNDILFADPETLAALDRTLRAYDVAAVSPVAFDVDGDRPVLTPFAAAYDRYPANDDGVLEGTVALGTCMAFARRDVEAVLGSWRWELPYMEDQVLAHLLKVRRGYAYLRHHAIYHCGYAEAASYEFDNDEVVRHLERLVREDSRYRMLLELRRELRDGADFAKPVRRR